MACLSNLFYFSCKSENVQLQNFIWVSFCFQLFWLCIVHMLTNIFHSDRHCENCSRSLLVNFKTQISELSVSGVILVLLWLPARYLKVMVLGTWTNSSRSRAGLPFLMKNTTYCSLIVSCWYPVLRRDKTKDLRCFSWKKPPVSLLR